MADGTEDKRATIIVFSGTMDKVMAALIVATTAAAMGHKVTMFFTFWGLAALKKGGIADCERNWMQKMLGWMLPKKAAELPLSQLHMAGMGAGMMKKIMEQQNMSSLEELLQMAIDLDIRMIACQTSMDAMGICREELLDNVEIAGAATYVGEASGGEFNLFVS